MAPRHFLPGFPSLFVCVCVLILVCARAGSAVLGWSSKHTLEGDMGWYYEDYKAAGGPSKAVDFSTDDMILSK